MKMTLDQAMNLNANGTKIREITVNELKHSETDIATVRPFDVYDEIMTTLMRYENAIGRIGVPSIYASHLTITSVNGKQVMVGRNGNLNTKELLQDAKQEESEDIEAGVLNYEDMVDVSVRYGRILFNIPIGEERKYQVVLSVLYSLEKKRLEVTFGARYVESNAINIPSDRYLLKGDTTNLYADVVPKLVDLLDNYSAHAMHIVNAIEKLNDRWLTLEDMKAVIARMHYVQACIKHKDYSGLEEVIDDRVAKDMHYLFFHSDYSYRIRTEEGGGSAWQCYQAINEALRDTDLSLLEYHGKYLQAFNFYAFKLDNFLKQNPVKEFENGTNVYTEVPVTAQIHPAGPALTYENPEAPNEMLEAIGDKWKDALVTPENDLEQRREIQQAETTGVAAGAFNDYGQPQEVFPDDLPEAPTEPARRTVAPPMEEALVPETTEAPVTPDGYEMLRHSQVIKNTDYFYTTDSQGNPYWEAVAQGLSERIGSKVVNADMEGGLYFIREAKKKAAAPKQETPAETVADDTNVAHNLEAEAPAEAVSELTEEVAAFARWQDEYEAPEGYTVVNVGMRLHAEDIYIAPLGSEWLPIATDRIATTLKPADDILVIRPLAEPGEVVGATNPQDVNEAVAAETQAFVLETPEGYRKLTKGQRISDDDYYFYVAPGDDEANGTWLPVDGSELEGGIYTGDGVVITVDAAYVNPAEPQEAEPVMAVNNDPDDMPW